MLQAQVNFWNLQETKRHNMVAEELEARNLNIQDFNARENQRHNQMYEIVSMSDIYEKRRHNLASENLGFDSLAETQRHNVAGETLTKQSNLLQRQQNEIAMRNAYTNWYNAQTSRYGTTQQADIGWENAASQRSQARSSAVQAETSRRAQQESARHNRQVELLGAAGELNRTLSTVVSGTLGYGNLMNDINRTTINASAEARKAESAYWNSNW